MRLSCRRFRIYCRLTFSALDVRERVCLCARVCVCVCVGERRDVSRLYSTCIILRICGARPSDTRPPGIRLPVIISPCQSPGPKGDIYAPPLLSDHPWTFSVCVIVIIRVIFFETIFFLFPDLTSLAHARRPASLFVSKFRKPPFCRTNIRNRGDSALEHFV